MNLTEVLIQENRLRSKQIRIDGLQGITSKQGLKQGSLEIQK